MKFDIIELRLCNCHVSAGQDTAKQALQEIVILPALRPEVNFQFNVYIEYELFFQFNVYIEYELLTHCVRSHALLSFT